MKDQTCITRGILQTSLYNKLVTMKIRVFIHHRHSDGGICRNGGITVVLCPRFRLAADKKGRFSYVFDRAGSQPAP